MSEIAKRTDLTEEEGAPGLRGDPTIEVNGSIYVPGMGIHFRVKATSLPRETLGRPLACLLLATTSFVLAAAGWGTAEVLQSVGQASWAPLAGMIFPTVVGLLLIGLVRRRRRRAKTTRTIRGSVVRR
jgi:hypothetical protein